MKQLVDPKHRFFIWAIIILIVSGLALWAYTYITGLNIESETTLFPAPVSKEKKVEISQADSQFEGELNEFSEDLSDAESLETDSSVSGIESDLTNFKFK